MAKTYHSGTFNSAVRSDCSVSFEPRKSGDLKIELVSNVQSLYGDSIFELAYKTLTDLDVKHCRLKLQDGGALPFVIAARIEAAVKAASPDLELSALPPMKAHAGYKSKRDRFRRTRLYLPGSQPKLMLNAGIHKPDGIILDLEDSVAPAEKASARLIVRNALRTLDFFGAERMVRINQGETGFTDLAEIVAHNVHLILIPKVEDAETVKAIEAETQRLIKACGRKTPVYFMPIIESAKGIGNAFQIAAASKENVALAIGLEDYTADLGVQRTRDGQESFYARSTIVNAARAAGIQAIDTVFSDVSDTDGLRVSVATSKALGFDGMGCIHPRQIRVIHEAFAPGEDEIEKAKRIVLAFQDAERRGLGVVALGSKMIDPPVVKRAQRTVDLALSSGLLKKNWANKGV